MQQPGVKLTTNSPCAENCLGKPELGKVMPYIALPIVALFSPEVNEHTFSLGMIHKLPPKDKSFLSFGNACVKNIIATCKHCIVCCTYLIHRSAPVYLGKFES